MAKQRLEFAYDGQSRRVSKKVYNWNGNAWTLDSSLLFLYDGWNLIAELNAMNGNVAARTYAWGLDLSGSIQGAGGVGGLLFSNLGSTIHAPAFDGNGNVFAYVDLVTGAKSATYDYSAFGETLIDEGVAHEIMPFRFSTKYTDIETGLLYYGLRYYSPGTGRWLSRDPIEEIGGENLCGFVENDPISAVDPLGLYQSDGHYYGVLSVGLAGQNGAAAEIAYWAQYPDQAKSLDAIEAAKRLPFESSKKAEFDILIHRVLHSLNGASPAQVEAWRTCLEKEIQNADTTWKKGFLLHALGDAYGHTKGKHGERGAYPTGLGHGLAGTAPDVPSKRPDLFRNYLGAVNRALGGNASSQALDQISDRLTKRAGWLNLEKNRRMNARALATELGYIDEFDPTPNAVDNKRFPFPPAAADVQAFLKEVQSRCQCAPK